MSTASAPRPCRSTQPRSSASPRSLLQCSLVAAALLVGAVLPAAASSQDRYGYYRVVDGSANVVQDGSTQAAQENQPLLTGDRLWTARGSRVEVVLADGTVLRVAGDSEVSFEQLADSGDAYADSNYLTLSRGEVQLLTAGSAETRIDTDNATLYLRDAGSYRVETRDDTTLVLVRSGSAEARTRRGSVHVRQGQEALIEGGDAPELAAAGSWDSLERWASTLDDEYRQARSDDDNVDSSLGYSSSRMASHGSWSTYNNRRYWRPRVGADWSPYRHGRWTYTPSGLTWVSYEPWGWVPYHYGSWDYVPGFGWGWYPGRTYAPAWVYWYWGPRQVGWCPIGYYSNYYGPRFYAGFGWDFTFGFGRGVHGWAGGSHRRFDRWNFVDCHNLYDRRLGSHTRTAVQLGSELPRGIISTETRGLGPAIATRPSEAMRVLSNGGAGWTKPLRDLPDVSRFVARDPNVTADIGRVALPVGRGRGEQGTGAVGGRGAAGERPWTRPGEKPAMNGGDSGGPGAATIGRPAGSGGVIGGDGTGSAAGSGARGARPRGSSDEGWRSEGSNKPVGAGSVGGPSGTDRGSAREARPHGSDEGWRSGRDAGAAKPPPQTLRPREESDGRGAKPNGSADESWRDSGGASRGREGSPRLSIRPTSPPEEQDSGERGARARAPGGNDESWRASGREGREAGAAGPPPVRRIVEGVRSNRQEPAQPEAARSWADKPAYDRARARPEPPPAIAPQPRSQRQAPPPDRQPEATRQRVQERPPDSVRERHSDRGESRGAAERGSRGQQSDQGDRGRGESRQGSSTRPPDDSDPNR